MKYKIQYAGAIPKTYGFGSTKRNSEDPKTYKVCMTKCKHSWFKKPQCKSSNSDTVYCSRCDGELCVPKIPLNRQNRINNKIQDQLSEGDMAADRKAGIKWVGNPDWKKLHDMDPKMVKDFLKHKEVVEGKSPHPKGSKKYKAHMAAKHANMMEKTPPGREDQVKALKGKVDNPYAVAWSSYNNKKKKKKK